MINIVIYNGIGEANTKWFIDLYKVFGNFYKDRIRIWKDRRIEIDDKVTISFHYGDMYKLRGLKPNYYYVDISGEHEATILFGHTGYRLYTLKEVITTVLFAVTIDPDLMKEVNEKEE